MPGSYQSLIDRNLPLGYCYPELQFGKGSRYPFGRNFSHPSMPMEQPFEHLLGAEIGNDPAGQRSAAIGSLMRELYEPGGFVALVLPFFSEIWLPEQRGKPHELTDFRPKRKNTTTHNCANWYCVRLSHNGRDLRQLCDPTTDPIDGYGDMTGRVRAAVEEL